MAVKLAVHLNLHQGLALNCHRSNVEVADLGMGRVHPSEHFWKPAGCLQQTQILDQVHVQLSVVHFRTRRQPHCAGTDNLGIADGDEKHSAVELPVITAHPHRGRFEVQQSAEESDRIAVTGTEQPLDGRRGAL